MFTKKSTFKVSPSSKTSNELALLISRMQTNGDQVEKDILEAEEKLQADRINYQNKRPFKYESVNNENLARSEGLLKDLFLDVDKAKKLKHPQANIIENDVKKMHELWAKQCTAFRDLYEKLEIPKGYNSVEWSDILAQKQREVNNGGFGPQLSELERQIAGHHILSKQVEAYSPEINSQSIGNPEELKSVQKQYKNLVESTQLRGHQLDSLYDYMQSCTKQLVLLNDQQEKIIKEDWTDKMMVPEEVRRQYESFKDNGLLDEEATVNQIQDDGERLIKLKHPGSPTIEAHKDAVKNEWQQFLNLCICQEAHLKNVEDYKKFHYDADTLAQSIKKHNTDLDNKFSRYNKDNARLVSDLLHQLENDEKNIIQMDKDINDLKRESQQIVPLKARRTPVSKPLPVDALCDWEDGQNEISRGEKLILQNNSDPESWVVVNSAKETKRAPGVCFNIPPPDPEVTALVNRLAKDLDDLKKKRSDTENKLRNRYNELNKLKQSNENKQSSLLNQSAAPGYSLASAKDDPQSKELLSKLDKVHGDLGEAEKQIINQLRVPIDQSAPNKDITKRLKDHETMNKRLQKIGTEKDSVQRECESFLSKKPAGASSSQIPTKLNNVKDKYKDVMSLADQYQNKAKSQLELENSIEKVDDALKKIESNLADDFAIPASPDAMQQRKTELQRLRRDLNNDQGKLQKMNQDMKRTEDSCKPLELNFQEYCPDIKKQQAEVQKLNKRFQNASDQLDLREDMLQNADRSYQRYKTAHKELNAWMNNLPNNEVKPTASLNEVNAKLEAQKKVVNDIKKKELEKDAFINLSDDLQAALKNYETNNDKYRASLDPSTGASNVKKLRTQTLQDSINEQEKDTVKRFAEVSSSNDQLLNQLDFVAKVKQKQQEGPVNEVISQTNVQSQNMLFARKGTELESQVKEEQKKTKLMEATLEEHSKRLSLLRAQRPVDRTEEKEVVEYYRDPKVEDNLTALRNKIHELRRHRQGTEGDIKSTKEKINQLEDEVRNAKTGQVIKEVKKVERNPALDVEAENLRSEIDTLRRERQITIGDWDRLTRQVTILEQKPVNVKEKLVTVEKVKVEKDPVMLKASRSLQNEIEDENLKRQSLIEKIRLIRTQIETLEKKTGKTDPKVMIKEIKKVETDPQLEKDLAKLRNLYEEESQSNSELDKELSDLQKKYRIIADKKPKVEMKEIVRENFCVLPETEQEITKLKKEIRETAKRRGDVEMEITIAQGDLEVLKDRKPQIQYKDITQEIVKLQKSPEMLKEIDQLKRQLPQMDDDYSDLQGKIKRLKGERDEWRKEKSKIETKVVTKEVTKYEDDPILEKEMVRLRKIVREESEKRRNFESLVFDLQNLYSQLERQKPEEKVVVKEMVRLEKDPKLTVEHNNLGKTLDEERRQRRELEREVQHLKALVEEKEAELNLEEEKGVRQKVESEATHIRNRITELESNPPPMEEKIVTEEVLKVEKDPLLEKLAGSLRQQLDQERNKAANLHKEIRKAQLQLEVLHKEKSKEKLICREVIRIEKDKALEQERARARDLYNKEKNTRLDLEEELRRIKDRQEKLEDLMASRSRVESELKQTREAALRERATLEENLKNLETDRQQKILMHDEEFKRLSQYHEKTKQKKHELDAKLSWIKREIIKEKDKIHEKDYTIRDLESQINREEARHQDLKMRETNLSTKISIVDPVTGEDLSPYEAYKRNIIDRAQYIHLQELECDWEEVSTHGPSSETSVLRDKKSGKKYSIEAALKDRRITREELQRYREGKLPISEFALLVAGEEKPTALKIGSLNSALPISPTYQTSNYSSPGYTTYRAHTDRDQHPIAGVYDNTTGSRLSITNAMNRQLLDPITAQRLLEAQAATGGIIDVGTRERHSVHKAIERNLVNKTQQKRLANAQKAFTGFEDPVTKERLSVGLAVQKGWIPTESAQQYLEAQYLTGGLVDPNHSGRVSLTEALKTQMIDSNIARILQDESNYPKNLTDPITKEQVHYKELMSRCQRDELSGHLLLPVNSEPGQHSNYQSISPFDNRSHYSTYYNAY
ncbi:envoplakin a isoform X1 [Chiloscyllium plagiosum]|uniref:envoplakin a isoform X1 n=2 Tax=Chiloscyllium plagiosum TaxID=36176 RepID=UPI001CB87C8F|nr:envoplakin a isoform X1 [Chiloscyllium plagiosum]